MFKTVPMLLIDFYKAVHAEMLPKKTTKSVSYFTPRMSRVKRWDKVVMFGLQGFLKEYLIDYFNEEFFNKARLFAYRGSSVARGYDCTDACSHVRNY